MRINKKEIKPGMWEINLSGKLTIDHTKELDKSLEHMKGKTVKLLIINLSKTDFIDSSGLGALIRTSNEMKTAGIDFILRDVNKMVADMITAAHLESFFDIKTGHEVTHYLKERGQ